MPGVRVGRHARIRKAIIDRDVDIPRGALIGFNPEEDRRRHTVSENGVVVVAPGDEPYVTAISEAALRLRRGRPPRITDTDVNHRGHRGHREAFQNTISRPKRDRVLNNVLRVLSVFVVDVQAAAMKIADVHGREILDSRGNPTVEVEVTLDGGARGRAGGALGRVDRRA